MKIIYVKGKHVTIYFPPHEMKQALGVLKALAQFFKLSFIYKVAEDVERDLLAPLQFHLCTNCCMEIDIRKDEYVHVDDTYLHRTCPVLKDERP
jgi:hypothetical protein